MTVYVNTTYRDHGAGDLVRYIRRGDRSVADDIPIKNRAGRELSEAELEAFVAKSERHGFEREIIVSPENGQDLSRRELERATRSTMGDLVDGRPTATYVYGVHEDTEHPHVHVALAGDKQDLYMDRGDIMDTRETANERFVERHQERSRQRERDPLQALDLDLGLGLGVDRPRDQDRDTPPPDVAAAVHPGPDGSGRPPVPAPGRLTGDEPELTIDPEEIRQTPIGPFEYWTENKRRNERWLKREVELAMNPYSDKTLHEIPELDIDPDQDLDIEDIPGLEYEFPDDREPEYELDHEPDLGRGI